DVVAAPGPGGGPEVKVYDGATGAVARDFFAYDPGFRGGVSVAAGDVNGDGRADVVTGTGVGGGPEVRGFDGAAGGRVGGFLAGGLVESFFAYDPGFLGGVSVGVAEVNGASAILVAPGPGAGGVVELFGGAGAAAPRPSPDPRGGATTPQGAATPAAPLGTAAA